MTVVTLADRIREIYDRWASGHDAHGKPHVSRHRLNLILRRLDAAFEDNNELDLLLTQAAIDTDPAHMLTEQELGKLLENERFSETEPRSTETRVLSHKAHHKDKDAHSKDHKKGNHHKPKLDQNDSAHLKMEIAMEGHLGTINCVCPLVRDDGADLVVTGSDDCTVRIWNLQSYTCDMVLKGHSASVLSLTALKGGMFASGSSDHTVRVYDPLILGQWDDSTVLDQHEGPVFSLAALDVGEHGNSNDMLISGSTYLIKIWDPVEAKLLHTLDGKLQAPIHCMVALSAKNFACASQESTEILIFDAIKPQYEASLGVPGHQVSALAVSPAGLLASGSQDTTVKIWNWQTRSLIMTLECHKHVVLDLAFLPSGQLATAAANEKLIVWNVEKEPSTRRREKVSHAISLASVPHGKLVVGSEDNVLRVFAIESPLDRLEAALGIRHQPHREESGAEPSQGQHHQGGVSNPEVRKTIDYIIAHPPSGSSDNAEVTESTV